MSRSTVLVAVGLFVSIVSPLWADEAEPTAAEKRLLRFLDRDQDDRIDASERDRFPVPMRRWMRENEIDVAGGLSNAEFVPTLRRMLTDLRAGRFSDGARRRGESDNDEIDIKGYEAVFADASFKRLDRDPVDGMISRDEFDKEFVVKAMFEADGVEIPQRMDKKTFFRHYIRIERNGGGN